VVTAESLTRQEIGRAAEDAAASFLQSRGLQILYRNYRRRRGELDLIAREADVLVVVEVRMRTSAQFGGAAASINARKQARIIRATAQLLQQHRELARLRVRFDAVVISDIRPETLNIEWIRHAFTA
jgi:putative endonuclease